MIEGRETSSVVWFLERPHVDNPVNNRSRAYHDSLEVFPRPASPAKIQVGVPVDKPKLPVFFCQQP